MSIFASIQLRCTLWTEKTHRNVFVISSTKLDRFWEHLVRVVPSKFVAQKCKRFPYHPNDISALSCYLVKLSIRVLQVNGRTEKTHLYVFIISFTKQVRFWQSWVHICQIKFAVTWRKPFPAHLNTSVSIAFMFCRKMAMRCRERISLGLNLIWSSLHTSNAAVFLKINSYINERL